jgi:alkylation response protein AidB-like acyl-CoA dehydrogenase
MEILESLAWHYEKRDPMKALSYYEMLWQQNPDPWLLRRMAERLLELHRDPNRLRELVRANAEAADEYTIADTAARMVKVFAGVTAGG